MNSAIGDSDNVPGGHNQIDLTSEEINTLVYLYLQESNFPHAAFALLTESALPSTSVFQNLNLSCPSTLPAPLRSLASTAVTAGRSNGFGRNTTAVEEYGTEDHKVSRGELVRKLWKALRWEQIEQHASSSTNASSCSSPFRLLEPHRCERMGMSSGGLALPSTTGAPGFLPGDHPEPDLLKVEPEKSTLPILARERSQSPARQKRKSPHETPPPPMPHTPVVTMEARNDEDSVPSAAIHKEQEAGESLHGVESLPEPDSHSSSSRPPRSPQPPPQPQTKKARLDERKSVAQPRPTSHKGALTADIPETSSMESSTWFEHRDSVTCLSWNPKDKEVLASSSNDGTARLWHFLEPVGPESSALRLAKKPSSISHKSIDSGKKAVTALVWHPDGSVFATASDGVGRLFTPSGQLQGILTYGRGAINSLKFNPSGTSLLAAKDDFSICLFVLDFDLKSPKQLSFEAHSKEVNDVDWLDDDIFASGGNDHTVFIYRANDRRPRFTLKGHSDDVTRVKWSPRLDGAPDHTRLLASVSDDGSIMIWKLPHYPADRGTASRSLSPNKLSREKDSSADDFLQVTVAPGSEYCRHRLQVVDVGTDNTRMNTLEWSPNCHDGHMIIAAGGQDSTVKLFNAETGECLHTLVGLEAGTGSIAFSPVTTPMRPMGVLAGGGWNGRLCFWDVQTGESLKVFDIDEEPEKQSSRDRPMMSAMSWRHDGQHLAAGLQNKSLMTVPTSRFL